MNVKAAPRTRLAEKREPEHPTCLSLSLSLPPTRYTFKPYNTRRKHRARAGTHALSPYIYISELRKAVLYKASRKSAAGSTPDIPSLSLSFGFSLSLSLFILTDVSTIHARNARRGIKNNRRVFGATAVAAPGFRAPPREIFDRRSRQLLPAKRAQVRASKATV